MRHTINTDDLAVSIMAVPPLALTNNGDLDDAANGKIIRNLEDSGVTTIVYGGNAMVQHWPMSVYGDWLDRLSSQIADNSWFVPSVGPDVGKLLDQAQILKTRKIPVALLLPISDPSTHDGIANALRLFHANSGVKLLVYIKTDEYLPAVTLATLVKEDVVLGVKYAVPREVGESDFYLKEIISAIGAERLISGFGEPPAVPHMLADKMVSFTAGCVCIAPALSNALFLALKQGDRMESDRLLQNFLPLEALRGEINEIRVLHEAVDLCGLAPTGNILLPGSPVPTARRKEIEKVARDLLAAEKEFKATKVV